MSDYLSSLVDRSLDRADAIQPRLPSLFEPAQSIGSPIVGLWQEAEPMTEVIEQSVPEARNSRSVARQSSPIFRIFDRVLQRRSAESVTDNDRRSLSPQTAAIEVSEPLLKPLLGSVSPKSVDRIEPLQDPANAPAIQPLSLQSQLTERQIAAGNVAVDRLELPSQTTPDRSVSSQHNINTPDRSVPSEHSINTPDRLPSLNPDPISVRDTTDRIEPSPLPTDFSTSHHPPRLGQAIESTTIEQIRSVIRAIEPEVVSTPDRSPLPTIQVTIGRIEVRATTTAPATSAVDRVRSQPPVMGLAEYLDRRGGGK